MQQRDVQRLLHIVDYCHEIHKTIMRYTDDFSVFESDPDYQRSVSFCLMQIGELSGGLSDEFKQETRQMIPWPAIRAMRNMVAHDYGNIDQQKIWQTAHSDIDVLEKFCIQQLSSS